MRTRQPYPKDYATHMPIIIGLSRLYKPKTILEFGAGRFSTPLFLDRRAFPAVEKVVSCESSQDWVNIVTNETNLNQISEGRHEWRVNNDEAPTDDWDLVFADSGTIEHKVALIHKCIPRTKFTMIHDSEVPDYQFFTTEFNYVDFQAFEPCTAVVWKNNHDAPIPGGFNKLMNLRDVLEQNCQEDPTDVTRWLEIFDKETL